MGSLAGYDLSQIPAVPPPDGVVSNFIDPPSQAYIPRIVIYVTLPLMLIFLALRLYARIRTAGLNVDDYLCLLSAGAIISYMGITLRVLDQAAGPHMWDIPVTKITVSYAKNVTTLAMLYYVSAMFVKAAVLALYIRIFTPLRGANAILWGGIILSTLFHVAAIAVYLGTCLPRPEDEASGGWLSPQFAVRVYKTVGYHSAIAGTVGTVIDFYILLVPLVFLWSLNISLHRTLALSGIFATGAVACIFSIISAVYRWSIANSTAEGQDLSWKGPPIFAFGIAEINIGIICSCMPIIFGLVKGWSADWSSSFFSRIRSLTSRLSGSKQSEHSKASNARMDPYGKISQEALPPVERVEMKGLKAFMRNFNRTKPATTQTEMTGMSTLMSVDYNYHDHLKQEAQASENHNSN